MYSPDFASELGPTVQLLVDTIAYGR
jgi:hypothetical protein